MELPQPPGLCSPERLLQVPEPSSFWSQFVCGFPPSNLLEKVQFPGLVPLLSRRTHSFCNHHKAMQTSPLQLHTGFFLKRQFCNILSLEGSSQPSAQTSSAQAFLRILLSLGIHWEDAEIPAAIKVKLL